LGDQTKKKEMGGTCSTYGESRGLFIQDFGGGKAERKRPLGRSRRKWEDNFKMHLHESELGVLTGCSWLRTGTGGGNL
jgi:hypothetical protein